MRGGTSKALIFHADDLPEQRSERDRIFVEAIGSPDPAKRQLDGMGGGVSSLSKVCVIRPSARDDADVDYTFVQVPVVGDVPDYSANCGNMSSAIGPFAVEEGLVEANGSEARVRIYNTNTDKVIVSRFAVAGGLPVVEGEFVNPGVAGTGAPIRLDFSDPGGAVTGRLLPTGSAVDLLTHQALPGEIPVSIVDATNAVVFIAAESLCLTGYEPPDAIEGVPGLMERLEIIRRLASIRMCLATGMDEAGRIEGNPKVALVAQRHAYTLTSGEAVGADAFDIAVRMISMGQAHRAIPLTGAMCTAVAAQIDGSVVAAARLADMRSDLRIGHASGVLPVAADVVRDVGGQRRAVSVTVFRTARRLMEGHILVRA